MEVIGADETDAAAPLPPVRLLHFVGARHFDLLVDPADGAAEAAAESAAGTAPPPPGGDEPAEAAAVAL